MAKRLLFLVNEPHFFISHRLPIAEAARGAGYDVHVASRQGAAAKAVNAAGFRHHVIPLSRQGTNPIRELMSFFAIFFLLIRIKPDILHAVTIKPVLYGAIAARFSRVRSVVCAISGLGPALTDQAMRNGMVGKAVCLLYRMALSHQNQVVIFQNETDRKTISEIATLNANRTVLMRGSGVRLDDYNPNPPPKGTPMAIMASRLLRSKGVEVFARAATLLRQRGVQVRMVLVGAPDPGSSDSVSQKDLDDWAASSGMELLGHREDIPELLFQASVVVHPSIYGEGIPKILVEAAAAGRPTITTDHPGCRDAIIPDETGLLCRPNDAKSLAKAIETIVNDPNLQVFLGQNGLALAKESYTIQKIVRQHLNIYDQLNTGAL